MKSASCVVGIGSRLKGCGVVGVCDPVFLLAMLCPATTFFRRAKQNQIVPWHSDPESSGDDLQSRPSKRPKISETPTPRTSDSDVIYPDEKNPYTPMPKDWQVSLSSTLGFSICVKPPTTSAGLILRHCKASTLKKKQIKEHWMFEKCKHHTSKYTN